jgi:hypothetical protein
MILLISLKCNARYRYVDFGFAAKVNSVPLTAVEMPLAAREYTIVFAGTDEAVAPVVNVNLPAPVVTVENKVIVPSRTVIAEPIGGGRVKMTPQE